jgi:hypothetical protein
MTTTIDHGLKEWDSVVRALADGRQTVLLRKGGIHETEGRFEIERRTFVLFPTWLHQRIDWVKPADRGGVHPRTSEPDEIDLAACAEVTDIVRVARRPQIDAIDDELIYLPPLIDMRFNYKPHNPLYVLIVRAWRLPEPVRIANTAEYAGCKSWVPFVEPIDISGATPAIEDTAFASRQSRLIQILSASR